MERRRKIELGALVLLLVGLPVAYLGGGDDEVVGLIVVGVVCIVLLAFLFERLVPSFEAEGGAATLARNALLFSIVAAVLVLVFWTGIPIVLGAAGAEMGIAARNRSAVAASGQVTAAIGIGTFAAVATFVLLLVG